MLRFDIIKAAGFGFRTLFTEYRYLFSLALVPFIIKAVSYMIVMKADLQSDFVRQGMVMLPSYFADGWMLAHLVRLIFLDQRRPFRPVGQDKIDMARFHDRAMGVMAGAVCFATIKFITAGLTAASYIAYERAGLDKTAEGTQADPQVAAIALGVMILVIWAFRFLWIYIPASINIPVRDFLRPLRGFGSSIALISTWMICFIPVFVVFRLLLNLVLLPFSGAEQIPDSMQYVIGIAVVLMDTVHELVATAAIAWGVRAAAQAK